MSNAAINTKNTSFDFSENTLISSYTNLDDNFILMDKDTTLQEKVYKTATLISYDKKIKLDVESNYPAIQVYTGQYLKEPFYPKQGICLEPQFCPNSPNFPNFPYHNTKPDLPLHTKIIYRINEI